MVKLAITIGIVALLAAVVWALTSRWNWRVPKRWRRSLLDSRRRAAHQQTLKDIERIEHDIDEGRN